MKLLAKLIVNILALLIVSYILPGFILADFKSTLVAGVIIGVVNTFIRPILQFIALPFSILTFGISAFLINVLLLWGVSLVVPGFEIDSLVTAGFASILLALISLFLHKLASE